MHTATGVTLTRVQGTRRKRHRRHILRRRSCWRTYARTCDWIGSTGEPASRLALDRVH